MGEVFEGPRRPRNDMLHDEKGEHREAPREGDDPDVFDAAMRQHDNRHIKYALREMLTGKK